MNILLRNGTLVFPDRLQKADLFVRGGTVALLAPFIDVHTLPSDTHAIDCSGLFVFSGFIDAHTHFGLGEGESRTADDFRSGSIAAAVGGVTTFIDFADQLPGKTLLEGAQTRMVQAADAVIDYSLHQGIYRFHDGLDGELDELARSGVTALKVFTTYKNFGVYLDPSVWEALFALCVKKRLLVTVHAEDDDMLEAVDKDLCSTRGWIPGPASHAVLRPARAEASAILRLGACAAGEDLPLYIVHVSSEAGLEAIRRLRGQGMRIAAETTPHYLLLDASKLEGPDGALFLMTPPLRSSADRLALKAGLASGELEIVATDHCAYSPLQKKSRADCREIPAGIPGTGEAAMLLFSLLPGSIEEKAMALASLFSTNPARIFGLYPRKGCLDPGSDADLTIFDPHARGVISGSSIKTKAGYSPYEGFAYSGAPVITISQGKILARDGEFIADDAAGRFIPCGRSSIFSGGRRST